MNRGWADAEVALHVGLGRRSSEHARIGVDEGQILALLFGEALPTGTTRSGGELTTMLSKGKRAARKLKRAQILLAADAGSSDEEIARAVIDNSKTPRQRNRRVGTTAKRRCRPHQMDVHNRQSPRQNGPCLSRHVQRVIITVQRY